MTESIYHLMGTESPSAHRVDEIFSTMDSNRWPGGGENVKENMENKNLGGNVGWSFSSFVKEMFSVEFKL